MNGQTEALLFTLDSVHTVLSATDTLPHWKYSALKIPADPSPAGPRCSCQGTVAEFSARPALRPASFFKGGLWRDGVVTNVDLTHFPFPCHP